MAIRRTPKRNVSVLNVNALPTSNEKKRQPKLQQAYHHLGLTHRAIVRRSIQQLVASAIGKTWEE